MIKVENLTVQYKHQKVLDNLNLHVSSGECILISGPSGCGKSTLAKALIGLIPHSIPAKMTGLIQIAGFDTKTHPVSELAQQVGMVFQNPSTQLFHLQVEDEIAFGPRNLGLPEAEVQKRVKWSMEVTGLFTLRNDIINTLSGGQKQHVAIAATLAMYPRILILDEPTASLDIEGVRRVIFTLKNLKEYHKVTILIFEHRVAEVVNISDRFVLMNEGRIVRSGNPNVILKNDVLRRQFGLRRPLDNSLTSWQRLISRKKIDPPTEKPLLELKNISVNYDQHLILQDINLTLYPGDFTALVGDNGAGKSTIGVVLAGLIKPFKGDVFFGGEKKIPIPGIDVSLLFQNPAEQLFTNSVDEEVAFAAKNHRCFNLNDHEETMANTDLISIRDCQPSAISIGQQQRTALASCLPLRPRLLILDEPTLGQDWGHLQQLMRFLQHLNYLGTTILLISHDYKLIHRYAKS